MKTLSHEHLHCRDFGSALLDVEHFSEWLKSKRLRCPVSLPCDFVQVEWMLAAIQRHTEDSVTVPEALHVIRASDRLRAHRCAESNPVWLLGGEAYVRWAELIRDGVDSGELALLDFASKLPLQEERTTDQDAAEWITRAQTMAIVIIEASLSAGATPKKDAAAKEIAGIFEQDGTRSKHGKPIDAEYIERYALMGWKRMVEKGKGKFPPQKGN